MMAGKIEDGVALDFKRVRGLESSPGETDQIDIMAFSGIQQAGPDDKARTRVQTGEEKP
jgi:hypothetical protein